MGIPPPPPHLPPPPTPTSLTFMFYAVAEATPMNPILHTPPQNRPQVIHFHCILILRHITCIWAAHIYCNTHHTHHTCPCICTYTSHTSHIHYTHTTHACASAHTHHTHHTSHTSHTHHTHTTHHTHITHITHTSHTHHTHITHTHYTHITHITHTHHTHYTHHTCLCTHIQDDAFCTPLIGQQLMDGGEGLQMQQATPKRNRKPRRKLVFDEDIRMPRDKLRQNLMSGDSTCLQVNLSVYHVPPACVVSHSGGRGGGVGMYLLPPSLHSIMKSHCFVF